MPNRKVIGNKTENVVCKILQMNGYWCHLFEYNANGQPCDIVALKDDVSYLIDVKHCSGNRFDFNRIEPNQHTCFRYALNKCGINRVGFAIYFESDNSFRWLKYQDVEKSIARGICANELGLFVDEINNQ